MYKELIKEAFKAKEKAYAPYSNFSVGAALLGKDNRIYTGCNIENVSFGATRCAEQVAIFKAISEGQREFKAIAIVSDEEGFTFPCGICRQVMVEFKIPRVILGDLQGRYKEYGLDELMPYGFDSFDIPVK